MKRLLSIILLSVITLSLFGCRNEISYAAYNDFITKLEEMDFTVISEDVDEDILQGERKWLTINETENISVYFYENNAKMEKDASYIDAGGTSYSNGKNSVEISWVSFPHFYKTENIIVLYVGEDTDIIRALEEIIGDQFAGYSGYNHLLIEPRYDQAQYRSEIGNLFYETDEKIGITTSFGFFIYNFDKDQLITTFAIDEKKAFGEEFLVEAQLNKDEKYIILSGYSSIEVIEDYHYKYDLKTDNLLRVDQKVDNDELYPLPDQDRKTFETSDWTAQDLAYYPPNSDTPYYPFKNIK